MNYMQFVEVLYYLSGPILAVAAIIALRQLSISKNIARTGARRDAFRLAADQCNYYLTSIVPDINMLNDAIASRDVTFFRMSKVEIAADKISVIPKAAQSLNAELIPIVPELTNVLNKLEVFALYFTSGLASEQVGFGSIGRSYCSIVEKLLPLIVLVGDDENWQSIVTLYRQWRNRFETAVLEETRDRLEHSIAESRPGVMRVIGIDD